MKTHKNIEKVLITKEEIAEKVKETAEKLSADYKDKNPLMICVLKGAAVFFADLTRAMDIDVETDFMAISSYGGGTKSSGQIRLIKDVSINLVGRDVVIVEDIVDSGNTLKNLKTLLDARGARSVAACCLLSKPSRRTCDVGVEYVCFEVPDEFVVGYGLDYAEKYRNLDSVCVLRKEAIKS